MSSPASSLSSSATKTACEWTGSRLHSSLQGCRCSSQWNDIAQSQHQEPAHRPAPWEVFIYLRQRLLLPQKNFPCGDLTVCPSLIPPEIFSREPPRYVGLQLFSKAPSAQPYGSLSGPAFIRFLQTLKKPETLYREVRNY